MDKRFIGILIVVIALITGVFFFTRDKASSPSGSSGGTVTQHSRGLLTSSVELIEFGDYQCPACGQFYPVVEQVYTKYQDRVKFTFRNFPIDSIHPNARSAHRSAEAAGNQGKYFEMYNMLYSNQNNWSALSNPVPVFEDYATQLGLNLDTFRSDFASEATNENINADIAQGKDKGVVGTPTFFLNGQKLENAEIGSVDLMSAKLDAALSAAQATSP